MKFRLLWCETDGCFQFRHGIEIPLSCLRPRGPHTAPFGRVGDRIEVPEGRERELVASASRPISRFGIGSADRRVERRSVTTGAKLAHRAPRRAVTVRDVHLRPLDCRPLWVSSALVDTGDGLMDGHHRGQRVLRGPIKAKRGGVLPVL